MTERFYAYIDESGDRGWGGRSSSCFVLAAVIVHSSKTGEIRSALDAIRSDLGKPDDTFKTVYDIVFAAQQTAIELVEEGMTGEDAHMLAHNVIDEAGYGDNFGHGLGHGIGMQVHEGPRVAKTSKDKLQDGMVFTIEPGIYLTEWGGVRIEDIVVMEKGKARVMSHAPKLATANL